MEFEPLIRVVDLYKEYSTETGAHLVLRGITLTIDAAEFVVITGPSGSGKSTFLNILGGLETPSRGQYYLDGRNVDSMEPVQRARLRNEAIGIVQQGHNLLPWLTVLENVALPLLYVGVPESAHSKRGTVLLKRVGLARMVQLLPGQLSGEDQQRGALARAMANHPLLLLADNPTGELDTGPSHEILQLLQAFNRTEGVTVLLVSNEPEAIRYARRLLCFKDGLIATDRKLVADVLLAGTKSDAASSSKQEGLLEKELYRPCLAT